MSAISPRRAEAGEMYKPKVGGGYSLQKSRSTSIACHISRNGHKIEKCERKMIPPFLKMAAMQLSGMGILLAGCAPVHIHRACHDYCVPVQQPEYCYDVMPGYVLSQDKYDPNFVPCKPRPAPLTPPADDDNPDDAPEDDDEVKEGDESSSTGNGDGAHSEQDDQSSDAKAGEGASATSGKNTSDANARDLL
jgi:hypothetical protein